MPLQVGVAKKIEYSSAREPRVSPHLGEPVQDSDDGLGGEANADSGIERVRCEHILMHTLRSAYRLCYGNQKVIRLAIDGRESLQEDAAIRTHPERPA